MLKSLGHAVHEASDGSEAIKMIELSKVFNTPYNCMFIDSVMIRLGNKFLNTAIACFSLVTGMECEITFFVFFAA
jgi:CheY-like chemotaxis protein